ncbi:MAG: hypothetical protein LBK95_21435, partial [Bifidobacteriaceae bacterium]|nr:hypothetical protein [Bifidobacteriaceae bacterium]
VPARAEVIEQEDIALAPVLAPPEATEPPPVEPEPSAAVPPEAPQDAAGFQVQAAGPFPAPEPPPEPLKTNPWTVCLWLVALAASAAGLALKDAADPGIRAAVADYLSVFGAVGLALAFGVGAVGWFWRRAGRR